MSGSIKIPLTESQKNLLQQKELTCMLEPEMEQAVSAILSQGDKYYLYLDPMDLENLVEMLCNVTNHEVNNPKLVRSFDKLITYLEKYLDEE